LRDCEAARRVDKVYHSDYSANQRSTDEGNAGVRAVRNGENFGETAVEEGAEGSLNDFWIAAARDRC